jgi:hypothetical protein
MTQKLPNVFEITNNNNNSRYLMVKVNDTEWLCIHEVYDLPKSCGRTTY